MTAEPGGTTAAAILDNIRSTRDALSVRRVFGDPHELDGATIIPVARISGAVGGAGSVADSALCRAISSRHSNRSEYRSDPVPASTLAAMDDLVDESIARARLVWLTAAGDRQRFGDLLVEATRAHVADEEQSRASFVWWRSDWDAVQRHKDGLTIDGVGLRPLVRTLGKLLPAPSRQSADRTFVERTVIQARSAAAFGVVVVDDPTARPGRLAGGRLAQRLHLWSAANGLGFQYMNQIIGASTATANSVATPRSKRHWQRWSATAPASRRSWPAP